MTADTPPQHGDLSKVPAALHYYVRGGHATKPKRLAHLTMKIIYGVYHPTVGPGCSVSYSPLTPYAKRIGVEAIENVWCP